MEARTLIADGQGSSNTFLSNLLDFCIDSFNSCFSREADKLCVPIGLSSLSALLLLLSCFVLVHQRCKCRAENPGGVLFVYCFVGNLCGTVGAILSRQLSIQILMGAFAAALDAVHFISCCFLLLLCWNSMTERRLHMMRKRRRQQLLAVCVLMVVAGGFLKPRVSHHQADLPPNGRRLLYVILRDNTEILGYALGMISFVIACTSRFPSLCRAYRGQMLTWAYMLSGLLCSLAGVLYTAAILLYDTRFQFLLRAMPWLLSAICCVTLDLLILSIHWCKRGTRQHPMRVSPDTESLLDGSGILTEEKAVMKNHSKQHMHSSAQAKMNNLQNKTEMGRYMDVSIHPARRKYLKEVTMSKEEMVNQLAPSTLRVVRVDSFCSSDTSYDSSLVSSDLEWDFEEANVQWREQTVKQQKRNEFPLQEWLTNPKPFNTCAIPGFQQKAQSDTVESVCVVAVNFEK